MTPNFLCIKVPDSSFVAASLLDRIPFRCNNSAVAVSCADTTRVRHKLRTYTDWLVDMVQEKATIMGIDKQVNTCTCFFFLRKGKN